MVCREQAINHIHPQLARISNSKSRQKTRERILGRENFLSTTRLEDVMGRFNAASLITEPYISIEEKEIDVKVIDDFAGYMILSNHAMPIRIEMGDERFIALNVSAKYKGNREYFGFLVKVLENPDTASSFMSYLLSRDLTSFNPRSIPDTQIKRELIEANKAKIVENFSKVIQDVQDVQEAPVEEVELVAEKPAEEKPEPVIEEQPADKGKAREIPEEYSKTNMEREWEAANGIVDDWDEEDLDRIVCALPTRPDIKELQYSGARFSRGAIARLGQRLQSQYPTHKFQILLPYENWKPSGWTSGNQPASLFSLLDHYDEAQLPDDADPDYFERFIIYVRDAPPVAGGCNGELNDCLYECLKYIYSTFSKMPKSIEKPEYIKKALGLNRDAPIPFQKTKNFKSSFISVEKNRKTGIYETLEEAYQRIHEERDVFLQTTKKFGLGIDLSYHNWSYKRTAFWLFERLSVGIPANDPLDPIEAEWLSDAMMGGLIWADNEWKGYGRQRDKFQTLNDFVDHRGYALYGLFRAKVSGNNILFRQNKRGIYTFIDLQ
ncbi:hypothetical protein GLOIN_2v1763167 [Rhizophagus irregularis DAOM 181602=DAOM 197198]|nr:hypothetical protein GLOIN_2v1763167 [Rhizophagus irregularis DAOM 181602=DAOM 197198]